jgi:hypothetical protein
VSENCNVFLRPLKKEGFKEERMAKVGADDFNISTTLESNKSQSRRAKRVSSCGSSSMNG